MQKGDNRDALVPVPDSALPASMVRADYYAPASRAYRTWKQYGSAIRQFEA